MNARLQVTHWVVLCLSMTWALLLQGDGGRIEINQVSVEAAGGLPFTINQPGSYVLTGSLTVPPDTSGIILAADHIRLDLGGIPQHITQRGNNRQACFFDNEDRLTCLALLHRAARRRACDNHALVHEINHVHLQATPSVTDGVSRLMLGVGREYARFTNRKGLPLKRDSFKPQVATQLNIEPGSGRVGRRSET